MILGSRHQVGASLFFFLVSDRSIHKHKQLKVTSKQWESEFCLIHLCWDNPELAVNMFKGLHAAAVILFHLPSTAVKRVILVHSPEKSVRHVCLQIGHSISETEKQASNVSVFNSPLKPWENKQVRGGGPGWKLFSRLTYSQGSAAQGRWENVYFWGVRHWWQQRLGPCSSGRRFGDPVVTLPQLLMWP